MGQEAPALNIEQIARACGVKYVYGAGPHDLDSQLKEVFREALSHCELTLVIVRIESNFSY